MFTTAVFGVVTAAVAIIGAVVAWGARHRTLRESDQENFDRRFHEIVVQARDAGWSPPLTRP